MINLKDKILSRYKKDKNGIYFYQIANKLQKIEINFRRKVAKKTYKNHIKEISKHHSIPVMDDYINKTIKSLPKGSKILDIGGGWAWHWRNINKIRPDIKVYVVDFIYENFFHAKKIIKKNFNKNVYLINTDANKLRFENETFDLVWSVQVFQHMPDFKQSAREIKRVLKKNSKFINITFNDSLISKIKYLLLNKKHFFEGVVPNQFFVSRNIRKYNLTLKSIFKCNPIIKYSEILFNPELGFFFGSEKSIFGKIDSMLTSSFILFKFIARQIHLEFTK